MHFHVIANSTIRTGIISGGEKNFIQFCRFWQSAGHKITLYTTEEGYQTYSAPPNNLGGVDWSILSSSKITAFGILPTYAWRTAKSLFQIPILPTEERNIIYSTSDFLPDTILASLMKRGNRTTFWVACLHLLAPRFRRSQTPFRLANILFRMSQEISIALFRRYADLVFTVNSEIKSYLVSKGIKDERIALIDNGVCFDSIQAITPSSGSYEGCFVSRIHPQKGIFDLLEAWQQVVEKRERARLLLIGSGDRTLEAWLKQQIAKRQLTANVNFVGFKDGIEKYQLMKSSRLFLFPSLYESWGIVIAEAMACGLPVVAYDLPIYAEIFPQGMVTVPIGDTHLFSQAVLHLLDDPVQYKMLRKEALAQAARYDWHCAAKAATEHIKRVCSKSVGDIVGP